MAGPIYDSNGNLVPLECVKCGGYNCDHISCNKCAWDSRHRVSSMDKCSENGIRVCRCKHPIYKDEPSVMIMRVELDDALMKLAMLQRLCDADTIPIVSKSKVQHILKGGWKNGRTGIRNG